MSKDLANQLRNLRKIKGDSLRDVENETGISNAYLSQLERGNAENPHPQKLYKLAEYYSVPYESLMRAAGYIQEEEGEQKPSAVESALMSLNLTEEEEELVVDFVKKYLRREQRDG